jgi:hypothetical protein
MTGRRSTTTPVGLIFRAAAAAAGDPSGRTVSVDAALGQTFAPLHVGASSSASDASPEGIPHGTQLGRQAVSAVIAERMKSAAYPLRTGAPC